jgi:hypothetical protein
MSCCTFHENNGDKTLTCSGLAPKWAHHNDAILQTIRAKDELCKTLYESLLKANSMANNVEDRMKTFNLPIPNFKEQNAHDKTWAGEIYHLIENTLERAVYDTYGYGIGKQINNAISQCAGEDWSAIVEVAAGNCLRDMLTDRIPMTNRGVFVSILGEDYVSRHEQDYLNS